jgi:hypothetical protein
MPHDLTVRMEDRPGSLASLGDALGNAGVNINGICGVTGGGQGEIHVLVDDAGTARAALQAAGIEVIADQEPVVVGFENRPGELGEMAAKVAGAGVNIDVVYVSCDNRLVFLTSDNAATRQAL